MSSRPIRTAATVAALAAVAVVAASVTVSPASAYTVHGSSGFPGVTSTPFTWGTGSTTSPKILVPWRTVYESTRYAQYEQVVCVTPRLYDSFGAWFLIAQRTNCQRIPASSSYANVDGVEFSGLQFFKGYAVDIGVVWMLADGTVIGTRIYDYNQVNDYRCAVSHCGISTTAGEAIVQFSLSVWP